MKRIAQCCRQFSGLLQMMQNMYGQLEKLISSVHHVLQ